MLRRFAVCVLFVLSACDVAPKQMQDVAAQYERFPQSAVVMGTVSRMTESGFSGESGKGSVVRFDTEILDPMTPGLQAATAWAGGVQKPKRFRFTVPSPTVIMPQHYALTTFTDARGYSSNLESDRQFFNPVWFDLAPGEVVYVGDIRFAEDAKGVRVWVEDKWDEYVVTHQVPQILQQRMHKRLLQLPPVLPVSTYNVQPRQ